MEFELPEDLTALSREDVDALRATAIEAFNAVYGLDKTPENVQTLRELRAALNDIDADLARRDEVDAELAAEVAELADGIVESEVEALEDEAVADDDETVEADEADDDEDEVVTASGPRKITLPEIAAKTKPAETEPVVKTSQPKAMLLAAADVPGFVTGSDLTMEQAADAFIRRAAAFPKRAGGPRITAGFATIQTEFPKELTVATDGYAEDAIKFAQDETRLPGGSLVASGGWCAPSETMYDLCELESRDGLLSLPTITARRGGVRFTQGPDFGEIFNGSGFCFTEQDDIDGNYQPGAACTDPNVAGDKPCFDVPCPDFEECRLDVCGVCITSGILQDRAYPELTARVIRGAITAHVHRLNNNFINRMVAQSTNVVMGSPATGAAANLLSAIELAAEDMRYCNRLARNRSLEVVLPYWARGVIRADLSRRLGVDLLDVSDRMINSWFAQRGVSVQYVYDWQDSFDCGPNALPFGDCQNPQTTWPTQVNFLIYPSGTFIAARTDVIELTAVHDSAMFQQNNFTALFTEEAYCVIKKCHDARNVQVALCPDGSTGAGVAIACPTA